MKVVLYVEGGGDTAQQQRQCASGFRKLIQSIVPGSKNMPSVIACGSRGEAFKDFQTALSQQHRRKDELYALLVDSEDLVSATTAWEHLNRREEDKWPRPVASSEDQAQLMTVMVETWLVADPDNIARFFAPKFDKTKLPTAPDLETVAKANVMSALNAAAKKTRSGLYEKKDAFNLLGTTDPARIATRCPTWGARFVAFVRANCA